MNEISVNDYNNMGEGIVSLSNSSNTHQKHEYLDKSIWSIFFYYASIVWGISFIIYWSLKYLVAHCTIINIGSNSVGYDRVSQFDTDAAEVSERSHDPLSGSPVNRLFPSDENLQLWDIEMKKVSDNLPKCSHNTENIYEYGLGDDDNVYE